MKIVLFKDVPDLGEADTLVNVSEGYARNYLLPRKLAGPATPAILAGMEKRHAEKEKQRAEKKAEFEALAGKLSSQEIVIEADAGEGGKLFGSVTAQDIAEALHKACQVEVDKRKVELGDPIKLVGEYTVPVKLFKDITAELKIKVVSK
ncbi:MAG: 50S ribosomal protein L9 [Candidatus Margulisbacteria bacterium]|nr:50S ribosomal protein L9 [Candidatus Margulisiibacteriota bacterium]